MHNMVKYVGRASASLDEARQFKKQHFETTYMSHICEVAVVVVPGKCKTGLPMLLRP